MARDVDVEEDAELHNLERSGGDAAPAPAAASSGSRSKASAPEHSAQNPSRADFTVEELAARSKQPKAPGKASSTAAPICPPREQMRGRAPQRSSAAHLLPSGGSSTCSLVDFLVAFLSISRSSPPHPLRAVLL